MKSGFLPHMQAARVLAMLAGIFGGLGVATAQTLPNTVTVGGATSQFQSWKLPSGASFLDVQADQQTGLTQGDFMGLTAGATGYSSVPSTDVASSMVTSGQINGVDHIVFRYRMTDKNGNKTYVGSTISVGFNFSELTAAGKLTIVASVDSSNSGNNLFFQSPGTGLNDGPSTTTLDNGAFVGNPYSKAAPLALTTGTNWSYITNLSTLGETSYDRTGVSGTDANSYITFAIKFSDLQAATRALTGSSTFTLTSATEMAFIGWTATQTNSINQDINGVSGIPTTSWSAMGAFTDYVTADGRKKPVPEAATMAQVGGLLFVGVAGGYLRRRRVVRAATVPALVAAR